MTLHYRAHRSGCIHDLRILIVAIVLAATAPAALAAPTAVFWTDRDNATLNFNDLRGNNVVLANGTRMQDVILDASAGVLYYSDWGLGAGDPADGTISRINVDGTGQATIFTGGDAIHQLALDSSGGRIYFARGVSYAGWEVSGVNVDGSGYAAIDSGTLGQNGGHFPSGIAFDGANGRVFFSDIGVISTRGSVNRIDLNGANFTALTPHVDGQGRNFAYDPNAGLIFLTQHGGLSPGSGGGIFVYDVNAGTINPLPVSATTGNWGIQVDPAEQRVYYTDYGTGEIRSARYDGSDEQVLLSGLTNPYGLAIAFSGFGADAQPIPTMGLLGLAALALVLLAAAGWRLRRA